jgi:hypothetical protein
MGVKCLLLTGYEPLRLNDLTIENGLQQVSWAVSLDKFRYTSRCCAKSTYGLRKTTVKMEHRNGFSSVSGSSIQKFDGKNYKDWAFEMELLLSQERAWSIVSGEEKAPAGPVDEVEEEVDKDGKVIVAGKPAVVASSNYNDYLWRYDAAVRLIVMALDRSLSRQYMTIRDPLELRKALKHDYIGELQKSHVWVKRDLHEVKLKDHGSVKAYAMRFQERIDQYAAGAKLATNRISKADHVFFLLNGIPQSDEWDVELRLITDQIEVLGDDPRAVIEKLCHREGKITFSRGITSEIALYTKSGGFANGRITCQTKILHTHLRSTTSILP